MIKDIDLQNIYRAQWKTTVFAFHCFSITFIGKILSPWKREYLQTLLKRVKWTETLKVSFRRDLNRYSLFLFDMYPINYKQILLQQS